MIFWEIIRKFFGYVVFRAFGGFSEGFLNEAKRSGIKIWDVKKTDGAMLGKMSISDYKKIRKCAAKSGMKVKIYKRVGFPFFRKRYSHRFGLLIGGVLFAALLVYFSSIIWIVEVKGNDKIDRDEIIAAFEKAGLKPGVLKSCIVPDEMQYTVQNEIEGISWVALNLNGAVATAEIRELTEVPEMVERDKICNVCAKLDGEILSISALMGQKCVRVGDGVVKGQLLISGVYETDMGVTMYRHAMGSVIARTTREITVEIPMRQEKIIYTGDEKNRYSIDIFGFKLRLYFGSFDESWLERDDEARLVIGERSFPFAFCSENYKKYEIEEKTISPSDAEFQAKLEMQKKLDELKADVEVENVSYSMNYDENVFVYTARCTCIEEIAVQREIIFEENTEN